MLARFLWVGVSLLETVRHYITRHKTCIARGVWTTWMMFANQSRSPERLTSPQKNELAVEMTALIYCSFESRNGIKAFVLTFTDCFLNFKMCIYVPQTQRFPSAEKNERMKTYLWHPCHPCGSRVPPIFRFTDSHGGLIWLPHWWETLAVTMMVRKGKRSWQGHAAKHQGPCVLCVCARRCTTPLIVAELFRKSPPHTLCINTFELILLEVAGLK